MDETKDMDMEYEEVYVPDTASLAMYVNAAKGSGRTMAEFAAVCDEVSAATFSRILHRKIKKPLSAKLIRKIAENSADPEITVERLMRANGMVPKDGRRERRDPDIMRQSDANRNANITIRNIITNGLWDRGYMLGFFQKLPFKQLPESRFSLRRLSSFAVRIQGCEPMYWNFHVEYLGEGAVSVRFYLRSMMTWLAPLFLADAWEPETMKDVKNSFVFAEPEFYSAFCDMMEQIKVNTCMSVILIDLEKLTVVEERMIPRHDGQKFESLFDNEIVEVDDYDE